MQRNHSLVLPLSLVLPFATGLDRSCRSARTGLRDFVFTDTVAARTPNPLFSEPADPVVLGTYRLRPNGLTCPAQAWITVTVAGAGGTRRPPQGDLHLRVGVLFRHAHIVIQPCTPPHDLGSLPSACTTAFLFRADGNGTSRAPVAVEVTVGWVTESFRNLSNSSAR